MIAVMGSLTPLANALSVLAYMDPTSGGTLLQLLLGGTAGLAVLWRLLRAHIRRDTPRGTPAEPTVPKDETPSHAT